MAYRRILVKELFRLDLNEIIKYISLELSNNETAKTLLNNIQNLFERIREFPELYPVVDMTSTDFSKVRRAIVGNYIILYFFDKEKDIIVVLRIIHGKRQINRLLKML